MCTVQSCYGAFNIDGCGPKGQSIGKSLQPIYPEACFLTVIDDNTTTQFNNHNIARQLWQQTVPFYQTHEFHA